MTPKDRLKEFIKREGINQSSLAKKLKLTTASVSTIFTGKSNITYQFVLSLKAQYNLNPDWLLYRKEPMYLNPSKPNYQDPAQSDLNQAYESLSEEAKKRLLELAKKEQEKERKRAEAMPERKSDPANDTGLILEAIGGIKDELKDEIKKTNQEIHKTNKDVESLKKKMEELSSDQKPTQRSERSDQVNAKNVGLP